MKVFHNRLLRKNPRRLPGLTEMWNEIVQKMFLDRERAARNLDDLCRMSLLVREIFLEEAWVDCSTHQNDFNGFFSCFPVCKKTLQDHQEQIRIYISLMNFIDDNV